MRNTIFERTIFLSSVFIFLYFQVAEAWLYASADGSGVNVISSFTIGTSSSPQILSVSGTTNINGQLTSSNANFENVTGSSLNVTNGVFNSVSIQTANIQNSITQSQTVNGIDIASKFAQYDATITSLTNLNNQLQLFHFVSGMTIAWHSATVPTGFLLCNGQVVSRTTYASLFSAIGTTFGAPDSLTFNVPNLQGRVLVGLSPAEPEWDTLGEVGGQRTVTLTVNNMPAHDHGGSSTTGTGQLSTAAYRIVTQGVGTQSANNHWLGWAGGSFIEYADNNWPGQPHTHPVTIASQGSGAAFDAKMPYHTVYYIIKT